ncbi:MAG TPA: BACON domain-containing carbohydrate-binding protein [Pyrinomonadaceae bacterium]
MLANSIFAQGTPNIAWQGSHTNYANSVAFSPDGQLVASGSTDRTTKVWRASDGMLLRTLTQCSGLGCRGVSAVGFSPDGQILATTGTGTKLWNAADGTLIRSISAGGANMAFSPDGQTIALSAAGPGYNNPLLILLRVADGTQIRTLVGGGGSPVAFSPNGQIIAAAGSGLDMWNVADGTLIRHLNGGRSALAFSPDGQLIAASGNGVGDYRYDDTISFYRVSDGARVRTMTRTGAVTSLVFTAGGQTLVSGSWDTNENPVNGFTDSTGCIRFWNVSDGAALQTYDVQTGTSANSVSVSANGQRFGYAHESQVVVANFPPLSCPMTVSPNSSIIPTGGGSGSVNVVASPDCQWTAVSRVDWITVTGGASGTGNGTVTYTVTPPSLASPEGGYNSMVGQIIIANQSFIVNWGGDGDGCYQSPIPNNASFAASGGDGSFFVYSPSGCAWTPISNVSWITAPTDVHIADGGVTFHVAPNTSGAPRTGTITIGDGTYTVNQLTDACVYTLSTTTQAVIAGGGQQTVSVTALGGCAWTATSNADWLHVTYGSNGIGNDTVYYYVDYNNSLNPRTGTLTIAGQTLTVNQAGVSCDTTISPASRSFTASGGSAFINVHLNDICAWSSHSNAAWLTITDASGTPIGNVSGTGDGTIYYAVAANSSGSTRTGTISVNDQTFTVIEGTEATQGAPDIVWMKDGHNGAVTSVAISPDGQYVASCGTDNNVKLWRVSDGSLVATLTGHYDGINAVAFSPNGEMLASAGQDRSIKLWDVSNRSLIRSMGSTEFVLSVAFAPDNQWLTSGGGYSDNALKNWRLSDGQNTGIYQDSAGQNNAVAYSPDGHLLASGRANGTIFLQNLLDYQQNRVLYTDTYGVSSIAFSSNSQTLVSGSDTNQSIKLFATTNGQLLRTFTGPSGFVHSVALHPNGQTILSGGEDFGGSYRGTLLFWRVSDGALLRAYTGETGGSINSAQYSPDGLLFAYGRSDGKVALARNPFTTDFAVWRPADGTWHIRRSADGSVTSQQWGQNGDKPVSGDYDGDGKLDLAVFRPSNGAWYILKSSDGSFRSQPFGLSTDVPVPGDYDGDGKTDIAVWRPGEGIFYIWQSATDSLRAVAWGTNGDKPVPGDYDGDRRTDLAVYRPANGTWYVLRSSDNSLSALRWGVSTDKAVPGDYDGDGRTDVAVWRPESGTWYILRSTNGGMTSMAWGVSDDVPQPGDFDGDGKTDIAVWRAVTGTWHVVKSSNGAFIELHWGNNGDVPVASRYLIQ